jgi:hypothetical protein
VSDIISSIVYEKKGFGSIHPVLAKKEELLSIIKHNSIFSLFKEPFFFHLYTLCRAIIGFVFNKYFPAILIFYRKRRDIRNEK